MKNVNLFFGDYETVKKALPPYSYFEFELQYEQCDNELNRFLWESRKEMTEYKNRYSGTVVIDLSKWNHKAEKPFFEAFQYFLLDSDNELIFILDEKPSERLLQSLRQKFKVSLKELHVTNKSTNSRRIGFCYEEDNENVRS